MAGLGRLRPSPVPGAGLHSVPRKSKPAYTLLLTAPAQRILSPIGGLLPSRLNPNPQIPDADPAHLRSPSRMERMQWLGILDLAHTLSQSAARVKPVEPGSIDAARVKPAPPPPSRWSLRYGPNRLLCGGGCVSWLLLSWDACGFLPPERWGRESVLCANICSFYSARPVSSWI